MKIRVTLKDPDCLYECVEDAVKKALRSVPDLSDDEREQLQEKRADQIREKLTDKWFEYGEYLEVDIDTDAMTATVVERGK
ncbi:MAG: hypothetical protein AB7J46_06165 [Candidatus Altimarinota bacterium]